MAMYPAVAASSSACVGFTSVPSKSMSKALTAIFFSVSIVNPFEEGWLGSYTFCRVLLRAKSI